MTQSNFDEFPNLDEWLKHHGFVDNPFTLTSLCAEEAVGLFDDEGAYLVVPPYYSEIRGNEKDHGPRFIFAPRGGGKTTIIRLIEQDIETELRNKKNQANTFAVIYDDFDLVISRARYRSDELTPKHHVEQIITLVLEKLLGILGIKEQRKRVKKLNQGNKKMLFQYVKDFGSFHPLQRDHLLKTVKGLKKSLSKDENVALLADFLTAFEDTLSLPGISLRGLARFVSQVFTRKKKERILDLISARKLLEDTIKICGFFGFDQIYVLIDNIDDAFFLDAKTSSEATLSLLRSLGSYTRILQIPGLIFKISLPSNVYPAAKEFIKLDGLGVRRLSWNRDAMERIYHQRLAACWDNTQEEIRKKYSISEICHKDLVLIDVDSKIIEFGVKYNSPRAMLLLGNEMFSEHFCFGFQDLDQKIARETWERALKKVGEVFCGEEVTL